MRAVLTIALMLTAWAGGAARAETPVDVELILAVDVSRSMTPRELEIQRRGYAEALASAEVVNTITGGFHGRIALIYMEWAGSVSQRIIVDWTLIDGAPAAEAFAERLTAHFDHSLRRTSISGALDYAARLFAGNGFQSHRQVIDVSGDGPNNQGRPVTLARDAALADGVAINGLPLMTREGMGSQWHLEDLDAYYFHCVIGGPGAFVVPVLDWADFPAAVRRKMVLELSWRRPAPQATPRVMPANASAYDCLVGEKIWDAIWGDMN